MDIKDINDQVTDIKNLPFLINFLNHCNITGVPPLTYLQSQNIVANANATLSEIFQNQTNANLIAEEFSPRQTYEIEAQFQNVTATSFATLLATNQGFALTMQDVVNVYSSKQPPSMGLLTSVLQNNMSDIYAGLFQRIQNGETLTAENVNSAISSGLLSRKENIKNEVLLLTSTGMKIPKAALEQRMKGIRWQPIKGGTLSNKDIERVKKTTEIIKKSLEQSRTALQTAKNFVQLLKILESIYIKGFTKILQTLVKKIASFFRDVGSSGFYLLNMVEPYWMDEGTYFTIGSTPNTLLTQEQKETEEKRKLLKKIGREKVLSDYEYILNDFRSTTPNISDYTIQDFENYKGVTDIIDGADEKFQKAIKEWLTFYKPTTYASFIKTIADAFLDEGDLPSKGESLTLFGYTIKKDTTIQIGSEQIKGYINRKDDPFKGARTGRPIFSDGSNSTVMIIAFSAPNIINLGLTAIEGVKAFLNFFKFFPIGTYNTKDSEIFNWFNFTDNKQYKRLFRIFERNGLDKKRSKLYDFVTKPPYINADGTVQVPDDASQYPDFYGFSMRGLFPNLFAQVDELEARANKFFLDAKSSLAKDLDKLLKNIEEALNDLDDFIDLLDNIIAFFEALQTMGLYTLQITSNGGNEDIVEKLLAAEGFPGVEEGDKLRFIGGFVVCYGLPSPNLNGFDFAAYAKQQYAMMNYLAASEKFAIFGEQDMDPGSFEDYMMDENIGPIDYNSSLDKIFKKIF